MRAGWGAGLLLVLEGAARAAAFLAPAREAFSSSRQHHVLSWGATQRPSRSQSATIMTAVQTSLSFNAASAILPHPAKALTGGEDACFVLPKDLGVFDGVGGWSVVPEANAGLYSRTFANLTAENIASQRAAGVQQVDLVEALNYALKNTNNVIGSTTVCVASLVPSAGALVGLNMGDSGLLLLRKTKGSSERQYEVVFRTRMLVHDYNTPFQLGTNCSDRPEDGQLFSCRVEPGDVVLLASDGVLDNLYEQDVIDLVAANAKESTSVLAETLAQAAFTYAADAKRLSPWQVTRGAVVFATRDRSTLHRFVKQRKRVEQLAMFGLDESGKPVKPLGGKVDDISLVVARIA